MQIGPPKNPLHMYDPTLLQLPIFKDAVIILPFMYRNSDYAMNIVGMKQEPFHGNQGSWGYNEVGPMWSTVSSAIITGYSLENFNWNNWTQVAWFSTTAENSGRRILGGTWIGSSEYIRWGYSGANFYVYAKSGAGTGLILDEPDYPINDGKIHCAIASSRPTRMESYLDGAPLFNVPAAGSNVGDDSHYWEIGDYWATDDPWVGDISLSILWNRGLSPAECREVYEMGPSLTLLRNNFAPPYRGAIGAGAASFKAAWAKNSNQVIL
jgi:hypothetical protein